MTAWEPHMAKIDNPAFEARMELPPIPTTREQQLISFHGFASLVDYSDTLDEIYEELPLLRETLGRRATLNESMVDHAIIYINALK